MLYSKLFGKTVREAPTDAKNISYKLLYKGGFIRESTSGRYFILPLGQRVQQKIITIIKEEMDAIPELNWSEIARKAISEKAAEYKLFSSIVAKSKMTEKGALELGRAVNKGLHERYKKLYPGLK